MSEATQTKPSNYPPEQVRKILEETESRLMGLVLNGESIPFGARIHLGAAIKAIRNLIKSL